MMDGYSTGGSQGCGLGAVQRLSTAKIAALRPGIKILFMSGYTNDAMVHHGVLGHGAPFIQKPFAPAALREKIRGILGRE